LNDSQLQNFIEDKGYTIIDIIGLGEYFFLTRGIRPFFDEDLDWKCSFNHISLNKKLKNLIDFNTRFSRLKLWIIKK